MAFWLADRRHEQDSDWIQRFDPRFWTINFPRPMMASVVSTAPDALRVDCEFHHRGELAGLIWNSEDGLDHPLLAYETQRDYAHCVLRFRWRSGGVVALDQPNGPTLTIEGRDASGTARSWFVRLWNYAEGTPNDAQIELPFSALQAGFVLPGEDIHPSDIDRMFISLVPQGYVQGSSERLATRVDGWAELSGIRCEGERASLEIGDVMMPAHGEHIATAYDDSFNQTPARLIRSIEGLGYRGRLIHYVGMSHYFRLADSAGRLEVDRSGALCEPARRWHADFFARARTAETAPIVSLSYELLDEHCPASWRQIDLEGNPGLTGWSPPSALLSPANTEAMGYLEQVATGFVALLEAAGCAPLFQIGEPWWWIDPATGGPCLYDEAAQAAIGALSVPIASLRDPLDTAQQAMLDRAGEILAASTAGLAQAVRDAALGTPEILLLAFTPTVLAADMPDAWRANLPAGWAYPAFDRLQLEDYDWLTQGADGLRRQAYAFVDGHLGYPPTHQDYLSGFVLLASDAEALWPRIDRALDEARNRQIEQRFIWALPQIARDGYTRLPAPEENEVQAFDDVAYPLPLGRDAAVSPEFSTSVAVTASGHEHRNALWSDARLHFDVGPGIRSEAELGTLIAFFRARYGPARGFRLRDPFDFSSNGMRGDPDATDQLLGHGDGLATRFNVCKRYGEQVRRISRPVPDSLVLSVDGVLTSDWIYLGEGVIELGSAPAAGAEIRAGFLFDVPVRFAEDRIDVSGFAFAAGEAPSVPLIEIREAA